MGPAQGPPGPGMQRLMYDPALLEQLYERGLIEEVPMPGDNNIDSSIDNNNITTEENDRPKRRWWGNKYKDNK